jgi:hypothetical protein
LKVSIWHYKTKKAVLTDSLLYKQSLWYYFFSVPLHSFLPSQHAFFSEVHSDFFSVDTAAFPFLGLSSIVLTVTGAEYTAAIAGLAIAPKKATMAIIANNFFMTFNFYSYTMSYKYNRILKSSLLMTC